MNIPEQNEIKHDAFISFVWKRVLLLITLFKTVYLYNARNEYFLEFAVAT